MLNFDKKQRRKKEMKTAHMRNCLSEFSRILSNFDFGAVQRYVNLADLVKSFLTSIHLQTSASTQPRTSLSKYANKKPKIRKQLEQLKHR